MSSACRLRGGKK